MTNRLCNRVVAALLSSLLAVPVALAAEAASFAAAPATPLDRPAQKSRLAARSALVGVTGVEGRLIAVGERGHILVSDDGGVNWTQAVTPVSVTLTAARFSDRKSGWAVGHGAVVLHTQDGGNHWIRQIDGRSLVGALTEAYRSAQAAGDQRLTEKLQRFIDDGPDKPLLDVLFHDARHGFAVGAYGLLLATEDGGSRWRVACDLLNSDEDRHIYAVRKLGGAIYLAGEQGLLYRSTDDGNRFVRMKSPAEGTWFDLVGAGSDLLLLGLRGALWHSSDEGGHWSRLAVDTKYSFVSGVSLGAGEGYLMADDGGGIWRFPDGASAPRRLELSARYPLSGLARAADGSVVASGLLGTLRINSPGR